METDAATMEGGTATQRGNATLEGETTAGSGAPHSMGSLLVDLQAGLAAVGVASVFLGLPLIANIRWHLQVCSNASGRGVLRLIKLHHFINLLCVPAIVMELIILALPTTSMPALACLSLEWAVGFVRANRYLGGLAIALIR